jgi:hypothetical protein
MCSSVELWNPNHGWGFVALNGGSATVDSIGFKLFDGSVIRVGNELFMFSAATTDEIKEATTLR